MPNCQDGDIIRVTCQWERATGGDIQQNVYHLQCSFFGPEDDQDVGTAIENTLDDAYGELLAWIPDDLLFETIECWNLTQDRPMFVHSWPTQTAGECEATAPLAAQCSPLVLFDTVTARSEGKKYLPTPCYSALAAWGTVGSALQTGMAAFAAAVLEGFTIDELAALVPGNWSTLYTRFAPWVSAVVSAVARTQRRRVTGTGA
jgi:hypothetical protein